MVAQRKYPEELRERAVKMVLEVREREGKGHGELARVGRQLGVHPEALRSWMKQAEIDRGERPGTTTGDKQRISELEREVGSPYLTGVPPIRLLRPARPDPAGRPHGALAAAPFLATFRDRLRRARSLPPGGAAEDRGPVRRVAVPASVSFIRRLRFPQADPLPGF